MTSAGTRPRPGGAAEDEESSADTGLVCEDAQGGKELGAALDLVDDDQPAQRVKAELRVCEQGKVRASLEVE